MAVARREIAQVSRRLYSSVNSSVADLRDRVTDTPKINGSGPFADVPRLQIIGPSMIHASIPASSAIHTRRGTILGVNSATGIQSTLSTDGGLTELARSIPVAYQRVTTTSPTTLLIGTQAADASYAIVPVSKEYNWIVTQRKALLGWTQPIHFGAAPESTLWSSSGAVQLEYKSGPSQVALVGSGQVYQIELQDGETLQVNPRNLIAYTVVDSSESMLGFTFRRRKITQYALPKLALPYGIESTVVGKRIIPLIDATSKWLAKYLFRARDQIVMEFSGPRTLLVQTNTSPLDDLMDKKDVDAIIKNT
ncbi:hypothetical protein TRVA0_022S00430 [Trichomonascus vanleenenianus]|uniref:AIM24 family protein n=1 Tax=Trichomonascus vanleenenianus TaxID=2268995 RepID=UPI003EC9D00F